MNYPQACQSEHRVNWFLSIRVHHQKIEIYYSAHTHTHRQFSTLQLINLDCYDNQLIESILLFSPQLMARLCVLNEVQAQGCRGDSDGRHRQTDFTNRLLPGESTKDLLHTLRWEAAVHSVNEHIQTNLNLSLLVSLLCTHTLYMCVHVLFTLINPDPFVIKINYV